MKIGRWILLGIVLAGGGFAFYRYRYTRSEPLAATSSDTPEVMVPAGTRIKVEVLNATTTRGLARRATFFLRDRGFDVVAMGTSKEQRDVTLVLDRSGHPQWSALVARAFNAKVEARPDTSRYLDVTVLVGRDWRPPAKPFYP